MKKKLIAAGAASLAVAAMPVVSTFAAQTSTVEDTVQLTVSKTCQMEASSATATYNLGTKTAGNAYDETTGSPMTITCNSVNGWTLKATATALSDASETPTTSQTIPFGAYGVSQTTSVWSAKVAKSGNDTSNADITSAWTDYSVTAASNATVVSSVADSTGHKAVSGLVITPSYKAYAQANQASATYSGKITYTFAENS